MTPPLQTARCPACATIQTIPADSPRGFALHLRCQGCRQPLGDDDITRVGTRLEVPTAPVDQGWSVFEGGQLRGPMSEDEIRRDHRAGAIGDDAVVWHRGFRGWARLSETVTFRGLAGGQRPAPRSVSTVVDLTDEIEDEAAAEVPVVTGETVIAAILPDESAVLPMAATAGIYPIPRTSVRWVPLLVAMVVVVGLAAAGGVGIVAGVL